MRGINLQEAVYCRAGGPVALHVRFPVERCTAFDDARTPSLWEMKEIAWEVKSRNRGPIGFAGEESGLVVTVEPPNKERFTPPTTE